MSCYILTQQRLCACEGGQSFQTTSIVQQFVYNYPVVLTPSTNGCAANPPTRVALTIGSPIPPPPPTNCAVSAAAVSDSDEAACCWLLLFSVAPAVVSPLNTQV